MNDHIDQLRAAFDAPIEWRSLENLGNLTMTMDSNAQQTIIVTRRTSSAFYLFLFLLVCAVMVAYLDDCRNPERHEDDDIEAQAEEEGPPSLASKILKMNTDERIELYSKAFDDNKNQTVLTPSAIVVNNKTDGNSTGTCDTDDEESCESYQEEDPSIYLALDQARASLRSSMKLDVPVGTGCDCHAVEEGTNDNVSSNQTCARRKSSIIHPRCCSIDAETGILNAESSCSIDKRNLVHGNCVICFENMEAGETVVWSENKACQHVFHKHCMVSYLAHKKQKLKEIKRDENPCPVCRRKFVTVCPPGATA